MLHILCLIPVVVAAQNIEDHLYLPEMQVNFCYCFEHFVPDAASNDFAIMLVLFWSVVLTVGVSLSSRM